MSHLWNIYNVFYFLVKKFVKYIFEHLLFFNVPLIKIIFIINL